MIHLEPNQTVLTGSHSAVWSSRLAHEATQAVQQELSDNISPWCLLLPSQFYFQRCFLFKNCFLQALQLHFSACHMHFLLAILALLFFLFISFPHQFSLLPLQTILLTNATHRFNSSFMTHCKSSSQFIRFSLPALTVKLWEKILQCLSNAKSWSQPLSSILIHNKNGDSLWCWLDLS